jgi:hypothetical protein
MTVDYSPAKQWARYVRAQAIIESNEDPHAPDGDGGQARGLLQIHPADFQTWYGRTKAFPANTTDTIVQADIKTCASFYEFHYGPTITVQMIAQAWRLGMTAVLTGVRDAEYLARWQAAFDSIGGTDAT